MITLTRVPDQSVGMDAEVSVHHDFRGVVHEVRRWDAYWQQMIGHDIPAGTTIERNRIVATESNVVVWEHVFRFPDGASQRDTFIAVAS